MSIKRMTIDLDSNIHAELKSICAINQLSMKEVLTEKIIEFIQEMKSQNNNQTNNNLKEEYYGKY